MANRDAHVKNRFSPELALVDPDLADVLRAFLPDPEDCLTAPGAARLVLTPDASEAIVPRPATPAPAPVGLRPAPQEVGPPPVAVDPPAPLAPSPSPVVAPPRAVEPRVSAPLEALPTPAPAEPTARAVTRATPAAEHSAPAVGPLPVPRGKVRRGRIRTHGTHVVAWVVALGILAVPLLAFVPPSDSLRPTLLGPEPSDEPRADPASSGSGTAAAPSSPRKQPAAPPRQPGRAAGEPKAATKRPTERGKAAEPATSPTAKSPRPTGSGTPNGPSSRPATQGAGGAKRPASPPKKAKTAAPSPATTGKAERATGKAAEGTAPPVTRRLGWEAVRGADLYNVVLVRDGKRVDRWVKTTTLSLVPKTPAAGATSEYRWYVYPLFRKQDGTFRFGELLAEGTANVPSGALAR